MAKSTKHSRLLVILVMAATVLLSSCFTTYQVESGKKLSQHDARLIIFRKGIAGYAVGTKIYANGQFVGKIGPNRYISCWLPEGEYLMTVGNTRLDEVFFKINIRAGNTYAYYFTYSMRPRDNGRPLLRKLEDLSILNRRRPPVINYFD
jgi:hypothetical protein